MSTERISSALPFGYSLRQYRIAQVVASDSQEITYVAHDTLLERNVAIKELFIERWVSRQGGDVVLNDPASVTGWQVAQTEFLERVEIPAACHHPNILRVYDTFSENGTLYLVTRWEKTEDMESWLRNLGRAPNESELHRILLPLLSALETLHSRGLLHREITSSNIFISANGLPTLAGFPVGSSQGGEGLTIQHGKYGGYAPFELYLRDAAFGPCSDLYSLGAVIYRAITGHPPPSAPRRVRSRELGEPDPCDSLTQVCRDKYSADLLRSIDLSLGLNYGDRQRSAAEWRNSLAGVAVLHPPDTTTSSCSFPEVVSTRSASPRPRRRPIGRTIVMSIATLLVILVGGVTLSWFLYAPQAAAPHVREAGVVKSLQLGWTVLSERGKVAFDQFRPKSAPAKETEASVRPSVIPPSRPSSDFPADGSQAPRNNPDSVEAIISPPMNKLATPRESIGSSDNKTFRLRKSPPTPVPTISPRPRPKRSLVRDQQK